ncbi:hypothetical protein FA13DRAFT_1805205 [Coprinellus micaceus]|uniref:Uncharacterized protein n=1 Tax=Coprinellus micaceus TaxID=71717 RepID=A0A4Y7S1L5_COPMI|nr:hypothetical protein FA13DRAFT_1805205 [Coprinellus micaceus]
MSHNASTHTTNPSAVNYDFPANAQAQPSQDPNIISLMFLPLVLSTNMDLFVQSQHANAEATQSVLGALVERLASTGVGGSGSSKNGAPKFRDPRMFNGRSDQVVPFLHEVCNSDAGATG